jgi:hypothetical protein
MSSNSSSLGKTLFWGSLTAVLYGGLFVYADDFQHLAHTTVDACVVQGGAHTDYYHKATRELCAEKGGSLVDGTWWYVFAPIALAFALSYTHGIFTGLFWDVVGLKAKK